MVIAIQILLIIHVLAAMLWLGGSTFMPRRLRRALDSERVHARSELAEVVRMGTVMGIGATVTVVTGLALILMTPGGFATLGPRYHVALTLGILWLGLGFLVSRTTGLKIKALVDGEESLEAAAPLVKRLNIVGGVEKLLFVAMLVLMLWRL